MGFGPPKGQLNTDLGQNQLLYPSLDLFMLSFLSVVNKGMGPTSRISHREDAISDVLKILSQGKGPNEESVPDFYSYDELVTLTKLFPTGPFTMHLELFFLKTF